MTEQERVKIPLRVDQIDTLLRLLDGDVLTDAEEDELDGVALLLRARRRKFLQAQRRKAAA